MDNNQMREALEMLAQSSDAARVAAWEVLRLIPQSATRPDFNVGEVLQLKATLRAAIGALDSALAYNKGEKI